MKSRVPVLAPLLRSDAHGELLALVLLHPEDEFTLTEISRRIEVSLPTVHAEVARPVAGGLVSDRRVGQARLVRAATGHVLFRPLVEMLELTYGPVTVLPDQALRARNSESSTVTACWTARSRVRHGPRQLRMWSGDNWAVRNGGRVRSRRTR